MTDNKFIEERQKLIDFIQTFDKTKQDTPEYKQFEKDCPKTYKLLINDTLDIEKFVAYNKEYIDIYTKTNGTHDRKKFEADKFVSHKIALLYMSNYKCSNTDLNRAHAILEKKYKKNEKS